MTDLKKLLEDQEKQAKQIEANYHQIIGGINMLKYLIEQEATQEATQDVKESDAT